MFKKKFEEIFDELDTIERKLQDTKSKDEKDKCSEQILMLRKLMDQCIQSWLHFEEKVNQIQDIYEVTLPDELPDFFLGEIPSFEEIKKDEPIKAENKEPNNKVKEVSENNFFKIRKDASIVSFKRGLGFYDLYMLEEAVKEFEKLVTLEPNFIMGHFLLGHVYSHNKKYDSAEKELRLVLALTNDSQLKGMVYNALGNIYAERNKYEQSLEEFLLALEVYPEIKEVFFNIGATYYNLKKYRQSIVYFNKAINYFSDDWEIYFYLGKAYEHIKEYNKAEHCMEKALELNPKNSLVNFELGVLYHLTNQREKAITQYQRTLELNKHRKYQNKCSSVFVKNT